MNRTLPENCDHDHGLVNMARRVSSDTLTQVLQSIPVYHSWCVWLSFVPCLSSSSFSSSCSRSSPPLLFCLILNMPLSISRSCCPGRRYSGGGGTMEGVCACMCFLCGARKIFPVRLDTRQRSTRLWHDPYFWPCNIHKTALSFLYRIEVDLNMPNPKCHCRNLRSEPHVIFQLFCRSSYTVCGFIWTVLNK